MAPRRRSLKTIKKGSGLNRMSAIYNRTNIKTFCCENKTTGDFQFGTTNENVGSNCGPSPTGQCLPTSYKFRCFDTKNKGPDGSVGNREKIEEKNNDEACQYVAGMVGKTASAFGNGYNFVSGDWKWSSTGTGGKKSKRRKSNKKRRTNKRK